MVIDAEGRRWVVRAPQSPAAGAALEAEVGLLERLVVEVDAGRLPFDVPRPAGFVDLPEGGRAIVHPQLPGRPLRLEDLGPGPGLAAAVGRAIAAVHELSPETVEDAGLPVYEADAYRARRLAEVDEAARTGRVPTGLLRRWERALEDVAVWRFRPTVVHGDLSADHVLCSADRPVGVLGWSEGKVADPADDLAWLLVAAPHEGVDAILEAYNMRRSELRDPHLTDRALLAGELALARWLLHGVRLEDEAIVEDATAMLVELAEHTAEPAPAVTVGGWVHAEEPAPEEPTPEGEVDAVAEERAAEETLAAEEPTPEEALEDEAIAEEPAAEETLAAEEPAAEETLAAEEPTPEEPTPEEPTPEETLATDSDDWAATLVDEKATPEEPTPEEALATDSDDWAATLVDEEVAPEIQEELVPDDQSLPDDEAGEPAEPDPFPLAAETSWEPGPPLWESVLGTDADETADETVDDTDETADEPPAQPV